tara:strand:- start:441 stop:557 length:117 start_codon:yes stop_codon:yes gene_type:complete
MVSSKRNNKGKFQEAVVDAEDHVISFIIANNLNTWSLY